MPEMWGGVSSGSHYRVGVLHSRNYLAVFAAMCILPLLGGKRVETAERPRSVVDIVPARRCCRAPACKPCLFSGIGGEERYL